MAGLSGTPTIGTVDLYTTNASQGNTELGQLVFGPHGKAFRYVKAGELLVTGNVLQSKIHDTQFDSMAVRTAGTIGDTSIVLTNGTTVLTGDEFKDGSAVVSVTPGLGQCFTILGNSAAASGAALTIYLDRPLRVGLTIAASKVTLSYSPWYGVIQSPITTQTGVVVGVAIYPIASGEYGWVQTKGVAGVLCDGSTAIIGSDLGVPGATAGSLGVNVAGSGKCNTVGRAIEAIASGVVSPVYLCID